MKITAVIVLYKMSIHECKTIRSLSNFLNEDFTYLELILYDNSPNPQYFSAKDFPNIKVSYIHDSRNRGLISAYNYAFSIAQKNGSEWLLLLDHDTEVTADYVNQLSNLPQVDPKVAALVPIVKNKNQWISPVYSSTLRPLTGERPKLGINPVPIMGINSGSLIRVSFLKELGGFNKEFPLDYLDHWIFYEIYKRSYYAYVLNVTLIHDLSVMDYNSISINRYKSILKSEQTFYYKYRTDLYPQYRKQLVKRFLKQLLMVKNKKIAFYTLRYLLSSKG